MLRDPLSGPKKTIALSATVGQARVCVCVCVCECVCVCCEERRCGVVTLKSPKKTHISLSSNKRYLTKTQQTEF